MSEFHERLIDGLLEARWQPGVQPEFNKGENKQNYRVEEQRSEADKLKQIKIEFLNMPVLALEMPVLKLGENPNPKDPDTGSGFLEILELIFQMIGRGLKSIFLKRTETN